MKHGLVLLACLMVVGCSALRPVERNARVHKPSKSSDDLRSSLVHEAERYLGTPYRYGGTTSRGFDCSGLVYNVYGNRGIPMPRSTSELSAWGSRKSLAKAEAGDLAFFKVKGKTNHVAIVTRAGPRELWVIHSTTSRGVIEENVLESGYWSKRFDEVRDGL